MSVSTALLSRSLNLSPLIIQQNHLRFTDLGPIDLAQVFSRCLDTVTRQTSIVDGYEFIIFVDQLAVFFLAYGFDRVPVAIDGIRWVFVFVEHVSDQIFIEFFSTDNIRHGHIDLVIKAAIKARKSSHKKEIFASRSGSLLTTLEQTRMPIAGILSVAWKLRKILEISSYTEADTTTGELVHTRERRINRVS